MKGMRVKFTMKASIQTDGWQISSRVQWLRCASAREHSVLCVGVNRYYKAGRELRELQDMHNKQVHYAPPGS